MKKSTLNKKMLTLLLFVLSLTGFAQTKFTMGMTATAPTDRTIDVTLTITASSSSGERFGGYQAGINFDTAILNGGTISAAYVPNSKSPELAAMVIPTPGVATPGHVRLSLQALSGANGVDMIQGTTFILGTYKITNTVAWATGSNASLWLQNVLATGKTNSAVFGYPYGATTPATTYTTTAPIAGALVLGFTSASPLSLPLNAGTQDCATIGSATTTPVTCFGGNDGSAKITMSALTPSVAAITYTINGGTSQSATLVAGEFTITGLAAGTYSVVVSNAGCPDVTVPFTIGGPTSALTNTTTISACGSYTWSVTGLTYTVGGIYTGTSTNGSGCTVNETLDLTITPATTNGSVTTSICQGDSYTWPANGITYTTSQSGLTVVTGCNTATLNLTVTPLTTNGSVTTSICQGDSYTWPANGVTYTTEQSGVTVVTGCNTATLNLTVTPLTTNGSVTTSICQGESYTWPANGVTYTTAQSGVTVVTGCNTATLNLTVNGIDFANLQFPTTAAICQGGTLTAYGQVYEQGITEAAGQGVGIDVEFGLNTTNTNPNTWTNWSPATFNVQVGNNDEYQFTTSNTLVAGTYYYTFRYKLSSCTAWQYGGTNNGFWNGISNNSGVLTVNPNVTPTFTQVAPICSGSTLSALPTISNNGITGTWSPALDNTVTTTYTFTPDSGQCATTATMTIVVNPNPIVTFGANPFPVCVGTSTVLTALVTNFTPTVNFVNASAVSQSLNMTVAAFGVPVTSPLSGILALAPNNACAAFTPGLFAGKIALIQRGTCSFAIKAQNAQDAGAIGVIIYNNTTGALNIGGAAPGVTIPVYGITQADGLALIASMTANEVAVTLSPAPPLSYVWSNGSLTQTTNTGVLNVDTNFSVTVTNTLTGCSTLQAVNVPVTPLTVPTFTQVDPICSGGTLSPLPTTSNNGIAGTWSPALNNTATTTYTFTPTPVAGQCIGNATMTITVNAIDFANLQFPATETICQGGTMTAYGQVYEQGITEAAGQGAGITVEFGLNPANTNPNTWTNWSPATFNVQVGNNDEYQFTTSNSLVAGTYYYTFRYKLSACTEWQYGGTNNGFWNGTSNNSGVLTINPATTNGSVTTSICQGDSYTWPANGVTYTTAQSGVTVVTGCNTATLNLTINPATTNGSVTTSICQGDSYTWPANGITYTTAQSGVTVVTGCNTATLNLTVNTSPTPTGSATQTFNVVNLNDATIANLVVSPAAVLWYGSLSDAQAGTNELPSTTVLTDGTTYWAVNVTGGCRSTPFGVTVTVALGIDGFNNENFRFYPNPTSSIVNIAYSNAITKVTVMNLLGQVLQENKSNELQVTVDLSSYPSATYLIRVEADAKSKIIKVVKKE
ncbi:PA domain-containing protein [Flavobacterium sp. RSB2_4_14]|uniref:PA domain-containing protein n=1 Tax=Flavobacterium sp. RSB2_4_14 TaxID=3447665 RepID=UPI003F2A33D2